MNIVTRNDADTYLNDQLGDQAPPGGTPERLIKDVSQRMAEYTGRVDWGPSESRTEYLDGGTSLLRLGVWPVTSVTSIHDDTDHIWADSSVVDATNYFVGTQALGVVYMEGFTLVRGVQNVKVVYVGGYVSEATIPDPIRTACLMQIKYEVQRQIPGYFQNVPGEFSSEQFNTENLGLLGEARALLDKYRRHIPFA